MKTPGMHRQCFLPESSDSLKHLAVNLLIGVLILKSSDTLKVSIKLAHYLF